jgi:hypothetical protein
LTAARIAGVALLFFLFSAPVFAVPYNATPSNVDPAGLGTNFGDVALGDFNSDGFQDVLVGGQSGNNANTRQLRIYLNNAGTFPSINDASHILYPAGAGQGFRDGGVAFGDLDNDGHLDVVASGYNRANARQLEVFFYNAALGTFTTVFVVPTGTGFRYGRVALADFDNDGDLDIVVSGATNDSNASAILRVYPNLGNRTFGAAVTVGTGLWNSSVAVGDYNNDGLTDILAEGTDTAGTRRLRVFRNTSANGVISFAAPINLATGLMSGGVAWGDLNNDGYLDVVANGSSTGATGGAQIQFYLNNGAGGFGGANNVDTVANNGLWVGSIAVGDTDNDGDLDILVSGRDRTSTRQLRVYRNNGVTPTPGFTTQALTNVTGGNGLGYQDNGVAWGDFNNDNKIDVLVNGTDNAGTRRIRVFWNTTAQADIVPTAPTTLSSTFTFTTAGVSAATFKWNPGTDTAPGATTTNMLAYDLQVSTTSGFTGTYTIPGLQTAKPLRGNYYRPPRIYDGNTDHGVFLLSTAPWQAGTAPEGLRTDTTYYFHVRTYDNGLIPSAWSAPGTLWTGVAPSSATLAAASGPNPDNITLAWNAPGDDSTKGNLTGYYRIQYSTVSTTVWSLTSTPSFTFTSTLTATNVTPGSVQTTILSGLQNGATYYAVLWSQDDVGLWSLISNVANAPAKMGGILPPGTITLKGLTGASPGQISLSWVAPGDDGFAPGTWASAYDIRYSTTASQSPALSLAFFNAATQVQPPVGTIPTPMVEGTTQTFVLSNLQEGATYYFDIRAINSDLVWSNLSNGATTWALRDTTPPGRIGDLLAAADPSPGEIILGWTATGDDGIIGTAATYDIRYSTVPAKSPALSDALFNAAASVTDFALIPAPSPAGTPETLDLPGLLQGVSYYFAIKAADENPNWSALSNGATAQTQVTIRGLTLSTTSYSFGTVPLGTSTQSLSAVTVGYDGNTDSTFILSAATVTAGGSPWTLVATPPGPDQVRLYGGFNTTQPLPTDFLAVDVILPTPQACTDTAYALDDQDCLAVPDATDEFLWFRLDMPATSSEPTGKEQQIQVTIEAGPP